MGVKYVSDGLFPINLEGPLPFEGLVTSTIMGRLQCSPEGLVILKLEGGFKYDTGGLVLINGEGGFPSEAV